MTLPRYPNNKDSGVSTTHTEFSEVLQLISNARNRSYQAVNTTLIGLQWQIVGHISRKIAAAERRDPKVSPLARLLPLTHNLIIRSQSKRPEECEFYLRMASQEK